MGEPSSGAVSALREQFGDRKPPDITRKITACVACRKQKIKCYMREDGKPPCTRCKKRGLPCAVNKSLQMLLESDVTWKERIEKKIFSLESTLGKIANHVSFTDLSSVQGELEDGQDNLGTSPAPPEESPHLDKHAAQSFEIVMDPETGPAAIPGSVVSSVITAGTDRRSRMDRDVISRGVVTLEQAHSYLDVYQNRLDHFLYRIIGDRRTLAQVRASSSLLLAAICAVGALHLAKPEFDRCYQEFVAIAAVETFSREHNADDVRGLCLAAFWLSDISWTCIGAAVRIATEIQLHRSIFKALAGDRTHYLRTRLYYLVYVCDHHFSIAYGRPPMTRDCDVIRQSAKLLETEHACEDDARLVSQVHFWSIGSEIYDTFGTDVERPLNISMIEPLRRLSIKLDGIRADWTERFSRNQYVGNYPRKGVGLHYHFAKLYLYSNAFRGIDSPGFKSSDVALDVDELANEAILSATAILRAVVNDTEIQGYLNGLPTYFDVMIAFAVVFVLKVSTQYAANVRVDVVEIRSLVGALVEVLKTVTASMHPRHLLVSVARGSETLLRRCSLQEVRRPVPSNAHVTMSPATFDNNSLFDLSGISEGPSWDHFCMSDFDLLGTQDIMMGHSAGTHSRSSGFIQ